MIYVFKTSVGSNEQVNLLKPLMNSLLPTTRWNFDLDDCDKILRIESDEDIALKVIDLLAVLDFSCEELV